jgi:hypothetical protein
MKACLMASRLRGDADSSAVLNHNFLWTLVTTDFVSAFHHTWQPSSKEPLAGFRDLSDMLGVCMHTYVLGTTHSMNKTFRVYKGWIK